jgi:hypothetical protein
MEPYRPLQTAVLFSQAVNGMGYQRARVRNALQARPTLTARCAGSVSGAMLDSTRRQARHLVLPAYLGSFLRLGSQVAQTVSQVGTTMMGIRLQHVHIVQMASTPASTDHHPASSAQLESRILMTGLTASCQHVQVAMAMQVAILIHGANNVNRGGTPVSICSITGKVDTAVDTVALAVLSGRWCIRTISCATTGKL